MLNATGMGGPERFHKRLGGLVERLRDQAPSPYCSRKYPEWHAEDQICLIINQGGREGAEGRFADPIPHAAEIGVVPLNLLLAYALRLRCGRSDDTAGGRAQIIQNGFQPGLRSLPQLIRREIPPARWVLGMSTQ